MLSLCLVARNEEGFISSCLASAREIADEIILLDTGSTDQTVALARQAGARVCRMKWPDNYSVAFNAVRRAARGDWILNLDADEFLDPGSLVHIRELVAAPPADAFLVNVRNYTYRLMTQWRAADSLSPFTRGAAGWHPSRTIRLFRNDRRYCYVGAVHHDLVPSVLRSGGTIAASDILIHHYGPLRLDRSGVKAAHYLELARRKVRTTRDSGRALIELGVILAEDGPQLEALDCFERARRAGYGAGALFHAGRAHFHLGEPEEAVADLTAALKENRDDRDPDFDRADALEYLGLARERLGDHAEAARCFRQALSLRPDSPGASNNLADLLSRQGEPRRARAIIQPLIRRYPGFDMPRATLGNAALVENRLREAERHYQAALAVNPENVPARLNLALTFQRQGRPAAARRAWQAAAERLPASGGNSLLRGFLPPRFQSAAELILPPGARPLILSLVPHLGGGAGRVLVEAVRALAGYRHLVVCGDPGSFDGLGFRRELSTLGATLTVASTPAALAEVLVIARPALILQHWWPSPAFALLDETRIAPRVIIGHGPMAMPAGAEAYVVLSDFHRRTQGHLPRARVRLIPNGVALGAYRRLGRPKGRRVRIAMLTRLDPGKFPRRLVFNLPDLDRCRAELVVAGRGARRFEIEPELAGTKWEGRVRFAGAIPSRLTPPFLGAAHVGLHLTETALETCSLTIIEMLAAGLPVISQPRGCLPEMVHHGVNGFLGETEAEIAGFLERLAGDPGLRRRMGDASRRLARTYALARFQSAYRELAAELLP